MITVMTNIVSVSVDGSGSSDVTAAKYDYYDYNSAPNAVETPNALRTADNSQQ